MVTFKGVAVPLPLTAPVAVSVPGPEVASEQAMLTTTSYFVQVPEV
jgi:hypothetical protein